MTPDEQGRSGSPQDEVLAGEYVLGVLSVPKRRDVEARMASDPVFAQLVARWQSDMAAFNDDYTPVMPPAGTFARIEQRLFGAAAERQRAGALSRLWQSLAFWRGLSLAACSAAAIATAFAVGLVPQPRQAPRLVADLAGTDGTIGMQASYDPGNGHLRLLPVANAGTERHSLELWMVPGSGSPLSLGVLDPDQSGDIVIAPDRRGLIDAGAMLAVTLEPWGGSPTGGPTGPVVAKGAAHLP